MPRGTVRMAHICVNVCVSGRVSPSMLIDTPMKRGRFARASGHSVRDVGAIMKAKIELIDLGDAKRETRQLLWIPVFRDSAFNFGMFPDF